MSDRTEDPLLLSGLTDAERLNKFVVDCTQEIYLWESLTDWSLYDNYDTYHSFTDPYLLFGKFLYAGDRWSALTSDIDSWKNTIRGVSTTYGYTLIRGKFSNTDRYFAIVLYAVAGSPAEAAGLKRGDIIVGINDEDVTANNYDDLFYASSISLRLGVLGEGGVIVPQPASLRMEAVEMYENPIRDSRIIEQGGHTIGYLCYTAYVDASEPELQAVFGSFKGAGVTDVILDLRYNTGGHARTAQVLSSILAPADAVKRKDVYLTQQWNERYSRYWKSAGRDPTEYFVDTLAVGMDLKRLYVLTSGNTASASEATIIGLIPYLEVILVGDTTQGKYYGGYVLSVDDYYEGDEGYVASDYRNIAGWGMYIMAYRYADKNGRPDASGGLAPDPDNLVAEDYFDLKPFGDVSDPLLGRALERITGRKSAQVRASSSPVNPSYTVFPDEAKSGNPLKGRLIHTAPSPRPQAK